MSNAKDLLAPPDNEGSKSKNRKMTQAIIEDAEQEKEVYEFLEEDDDFEEFEIDEMDYEAVQAQGGDVNMDGGDDPAKDGDDRKLWKVDWDDEEGVGTDFLAQLRAEIK